MTPWVWVFSTAATTASGAALVASAFLRDRSPLVRQLNAHPPRPIAELGEGEEARVVGVVEPAGPVLRAPLSGRQSVLFAAQAFGRDETATARAWRPLTPLVEESTPFWVRDESGERILVDVKPAYARSEDFYERAARSSRPPMRMQRFLRDHAVGGATRGSELQLVEAAVETGERVTVLGRVRLERDEQGRALAAGYRDSLPLMKVMGARPGSPPIVSDLVRVTRGRRNAARTRGPR